MSREIPVAENAIVMINEVPVTHLTSLMNRIDD